MLLCSLRSTAFAVRPQCQQKVLQQLVRRARCAYHVTRPSIRCASSEADGPDAPSSVPEKFLNLRELLHEVEGTDFVFEDKDEGDVWAHENRLASSPPAPEDLQAMPEVKGALSAEAADILTAYSTEQGFKEVTIETLLAQLRLSETQGGQDASTSAAEVPAVLDVRTRGEYARGRVPGAINVPLDELSDAVRAGRLDDMRSRPLAVICQAGVRSAQATVRLTRVFNFDTAYNVAGGTGEWAAAGYPLETGQD